MSPSSWRRKLPPPRRLAYAQHWLHPARRSPLRKLPRLQQYNRLSLACNRPRISRNLNARSARVAHQSSAASSGGPAAISAPPVRGDAQPNLDRHEFIEGEMLQRNLDMIVLASLADTR